MRYEAEILLEEFLVVDEASSSVLLEGPPSKPCTR
jgi:hypothetical protein